MWFNSKLREEPYLGLTSPRTWPKGWGAPLGSAVTGAAWLSSARVVRCWVKSRNERNPRPVLPAVWPGTHRGLPVTNRRKVGMTSNHHGPYAQGYTRATMAGTTGCEPARGSQSLKAGPSSDRRLQLACVKPESLVIADQHAAVNTFPGLVHTARHTTGAGNTRSRWPNPAGRGGAWREREVPAFRWGGSRRRWGR